MRIYLIKAGDENSLMFDFNDCYYLRYYSHESYTLN